MPVPPASDQPSELLPCPRCDRKEPLLFEDRGSYAVSCR